MSCVRTISATVDDAVATTGEIADCADDWTSGQLQACATIGEIASASTPCAKQRIDATVPVEKTNTKTMGATAAGTIETSAATARKSIATGMDQEGMVICPAGVPPWVLK